VFFGLPFDAETQAESADTLNYAISRTVFREFRSGVDFMQNLTQKLGASVGYTYYTYDSEGEVSNYVAETISGRLSYQVTKSLSAYGGYNHTITDSRDELLDSYGGGSVDAGVNFNKALSLTRRTSLGFSTGLSGVRYADQTSYYFTGSANLTHELGRSWTATLEAHRTVSFYQTFGQPTLSNAVSGGVSGLLNRRVTFGANGGWSGGSVGLSSTASSFDAAIAGAHLRVALGRRAGLTLSYTMVNYRFDAAKPIPSGYSPEMRTQTARITFDWFQPLVTIARRADASR
jgi:hypothetical protein